MKRKLKNSELDTRKNSELDTRKKLKRIVKSINCVASLENLARKFIEGIRHPCHYRGRI